MFYNPDVFVITIYDTDQTENLSSGRYLVCINSLSRRQSASWWKSSNLLLIKKVIGITAG